MQTPLYESHLQAGGKIVDFAGWEMPIHYGSQIEEHHQVRRDAGMFDVSHMTVLDLRGPGVADFLRGLLANDVAKVGQAGGALYSCMLNEEGGVIDDLIVYHVDSDFYRMVVNAGTRDKDLAWIAPRAAAAGLECSERTDLAMIAVQGPEARERFIKSLEDDLQEPARALGRFRADHLGELFVARTGYTGEDGFEVMAPADCAAELWQQLLDLGVRPCGLGARDTLRLEAGMNLYGQDMDESTTPLESALGWTVALDGDRDFIGREALERQRAEGVPRRLIGVVLEDRGVLRHGQAILSDGERVGEVTSGGFSPTLERSIGFARIDADAGPSLQVDIRGQHKPLRRVKPPFVRDGQACDGIL